MMIERASERALRAKIQIISILRWEHKLRSSFRRWTKKQPRNLCSEHACSEHACSEHGCFYLFIYLLIIFIYFERPRARIINNNILRTVQFATDRFEHRINYYILNENITIDRSSDSLLLLLRYFEIVWPNSHFPIRAAIGIPIFCLYHPYVPYMHHRIGKI